MKVFRSLLCSVLPMLAAGCASMSLVKFPQSIEEFHAKEVGALEFMANTSLSEAYALVAKNTIRCHQGNTNQMSMVGSAFIVFPTGQTRVEGTIDPSKGRATIDVHYFNPMASGILQVIDFQTVSDQETRIAVHRLNNSTKWKTAAQFVQEWFNGNTECYNSW